MGSQLPPQFDIIEVYKDIIKYEGFYDEKGRLKAKLEPVKIFSLCRDKLYINRKIHSADRHFHRANAIGICISR